MIYAAGLSYLMMAFCFLVIGIPVYMKACVQSREDSADPKAAGQPSFTPIEASCAIVMVIVALVAILLAVNGTIKL